MIKGWQIPKTWRWSTIAGIASSQKNAVVDGPFGSNLKTSDYVEDGIPVLQGKNITNNEFKWFDIRFISEQKAVELSRSSVQIGDILIIKIGSIGYAAELNNLKHYPYAIIPANLAKLTVDKNIADKKYVLHWLATKSVKRHFDQIASKTAQPALSLGKIKELPIPLPPLTEQKRIAAILDKADSLRRKNQQAIQLADQFLRAVFLDMFGDPVTNPKGWELECFGKVGTLDRGKSKHRPRNDSVLLGGIHPLIQTGDVANSKGYIKKFTSTYSDVGLKQSRKWSSGTLCITIAANIAKTGILTFDACFPDSVVGFLPNEKVTVEYIQHWLRFLQSTLEASAPESAQKNINLEILRNLNLPVPKKCLQEKFSAIVNKVLKIENDLSPQVNMNAHLFDSLSQKAFAGEL